MHVNLGRGGLLATALLAAATSLMPGQTTTPATTAPATAKANGPWIIEATPTPAAVHPGDKIQVAVAIKNTSDTVQSFDIPMMWWAQSDNPHFTFPKWPARGGIGPAQTYRATPVEPGKSYTRTWEATITPDTPAGDLTFRIGLPLSRMHSNEPVLSAAMTIHVEAAGANPKTMPAASQP